MGAKPPKTKPLSETFSPSNLVKEASMLFSRPSGFANTKKVDQNIALDKKKKKKKKRSR
jgi:hypothetical protein